jgi:hypothetical protein
MEFLIQTRLHLPRVSDRETETELGAVCVLFILHVAYEEDGEQEKGEITSRAVYLALLWQCVCFSSAILPGLIRFAAPKINTQPQWQLACSL